MALKNKKFLIKTEAVAQKMSKLLRVETILFSKSCSISLEPKVIKYLLSSSKYLFLQRYTKDCINLFSYFLNSNISRIPLLTKSNIAIWIFLYYRSLECRIWTKKEILLMLILLYMLISAFRSIKDWYMKQLI